MKKGRLADIGKHQDLVERHKSYSNILSSKEGENEPIDLDCAEGPLPTESGQTFQEQIVHKLLEDTHKSASCQSFLDAHGYSSMESLVSTVSSTIYASQLITSEVNANVTFSESLTYFLKVVLI